MADLIDTKLSLGPVGVIPLDVKDSGASTPVRLLDQETLGRVLFVGALVRGEGARIGLDVETVEGERPVDLGGLLDDPDGGIDGLLNLTRYIFDGLGGDSDSGIDGLTSLGGDFASLFDHLESFSANGFDPLRGPLVDRRS